MKIIQTSVGTAQSPPKVFWGEIAPSDNLVQIYTNTDSFLATLEKFVGEGLQVGDNVVVIATNAHLLALQQRLTDRGFNLARARARRQYVTLDAREAITKFIVRGWPDEHRFEEFVHKLLTATPNSAQRVRVFGEIVAMLWTAGHCGAMHHLERLWQQLCQKEEYSMFCAYPRLGFTQDIETSLQEICALHSQVVMA